MGVAGNLLQGLEREWGHAGGVGLGWGGGMSPHVSLAGGGSATTPLDQGTAVPGWSVLGWGLSAQRCLSPGRDGIPKSWSRWGWKQALHRGHLEQVTQGHIWVGLEWLRRGGQWHSLGGTIDYP